MGGLDIVEIRAQMMQNLIDGWREIFGGELSFIEADPFTPHFDIFERMRIANESELTFRG